MTKLRPSIVHINGKNLSEETIKIINKMVEKALENEALKTKLKDLESGKISADNVEEFINDQYSHLTTENSRLREALQYYFDVLKEVRGHTWKDNPDHVLKKMIDAMDYQALTPKTEG